MTVPDRIAGNLEAVDATTIVDLVPADGTVAVSGFGSVGYPKALPVAIAESDREFSLTLLSSGSVGDEIDTKLVESDAIERRYAYQSRSTSRAAINDRTIAFQDHHVALLGEDVRLGSLPTPDVAIVEAVAVGPEWFIPSTAVGQTPAFVAAADTLIVEVNHAQPPELAHFHDIVRVDTPHREDPISLKSPHDRIGTSRVTFDPEALAAVVVSDDLDTPYSFRSPTAADTAIADHLLEFLQTEITTNPALTDSLHLQFGVGNLGNALMGAFEDADFEDRTVHYFGEVIQNGLLNLLDAGTISSASATSLALSKEGFERLFHEPERYAADVVLRPASVSNRPELIEQFGVVAINSALEVDIYGHVNSTHIGGTHIRDGIGGSGDFTRSGLLSVIALPATAAGGDISRIVPKVPHVDHTEHDVDAVATEHGLADLRGLAPLERAHAITERCADPAFRGELRAYLNDIQEADGHQPHDDSLVRSWPAER
jgi:succinyl-CoA:acetate CoA-transferase